MEPIYLNLTQNFIPIQKLGQVKRAV